jgi:electron transfer flavoprotein beta subunit
VNIYVCVKQVPDPETPPANFKIDPATNKVIPAQGVQPVIDPFAENAVEGALKLKDTYSGKVSAFSMGPASARDALKQAMAMGADDSYLLTDPLFEQADSYAIALVLATAIKKAGIPDLILTGRESADWSAGQTGAGIAEILGLPVVSLVKKVEVLDGGKLRVERVLDDGYEVIEVQTPAVLTVSNEIGTPRYPTLKGIMSAGKKPVTTWSAADLGLDASQIGASANHVKMAKLYIPVRESKCEIAEGETPADAAVALATMLRAAKVI